MAFAPLVYALSQLIICVTSTRVPESAYMYELLGLYLLYLLTQHRIAEFHTVSTEGVAEGLVGLPGVLARRCYA